MHVPPTVLVRGRTPAAGGLAAGLVAAAGGDPTAPGPLPPHPVPRFTWRRRGDPSAGRAVPVMSNVSCRISCGGRGLAVGSRGTLKGEEVAPLLGSPACATPSPHLELTPSAEPGLGGLGRRARCSVLFGTIWGKERLLVGCSDSSGFPALEAKQAGP